MGKQIITFFIILTGIYASSFAVAAKTSKSTMSIDNQQVKTWNQFADNLHLYHKYLMNTHKVHTTEIIGGYAGMPDFYREVSYYDDASGKLLSKIQWERENPKQIHVIEVNVYDQAGRLKGDYLAAYLPEHRNAPIQTLINLHYQNDELHSFRQFDASGARIYEHCEGKYFGEPLLISLEEDDFVILDMATRGIIDSEKYLSCFEHIPHIATKFLSPLIMGNVPDSFIAVNSSNYSHDKSLDNDVSSKIEQLTRLIGESETPASLLIERGRAYFKLHEFGKAVKDYDKALALDDLLDEAYFGRGMAKGRMGLVKPGIADLSIYIDRNPANSRAYTKRGVRYIWIGELENARQDLVKAIQLDPANAEAHDDLGVVSASKGNYQAAITHFMHVVGIDPTYQKGFHNLAMSYFIIGEKQKALHNINSALAISPQDKNSLLLKGEILNAFGKRKEAQAIIERAEFLPEGNWSERFSMQ